MGASASEELILKIKAQFGEVDAGTAALARLEQQTGRETAALAQLEARLASAKGKLGALQGGFGGKADIGAVARQRDLIAGLESKIGGKKESISGLGDAVPKVQQLIQAHKASSAATGEHAVSFRKLGAAASETDSSLGGFLRSIGKLKAAGPAGLIVALIGVVIALGAALIVTAIAATKFAFSMADAARSSRLMTTAAAGSEAAGAELDAVISDIASHSPLARDKIAEMGRALELAHLQGRNMQNALEAATTATSAIGDAAGQAFTSIAEKSQVARRFLLSKNDFTGLSAELEGTGLAFDDVAAAFASAAGVSMSQASMMIRRGQVSVKDGLEAMNSAVQKKFGKTVAGQMMSFDNQMSKLKENIGRLFAGVNIEGFLSALKKVTDLFSETTYNGYVLKQTFTAIFNSVSAALEAAGPSISDFIDGLVIGGLEIYVAFLKVRNALREAFGPDVGSDIDFVKTGMYAIMIAAGVIVGLFALLAVTVGGTGAAIYYAFVKPVMDLYNAVSGLGKINLGATAKLIITSLVSGLLGGIPQVIGAMMDIGKAILGALPDVLKMHSPSVLLVAQAEMAAQSVIGPLEDAAPGAERAMAKLGGGRPDFSGVGSGGRSITIGEINYSGPASEFPSFKKMFREMIEELNGEAPEPT